MAGTVTVACKVPMGLILRVFTMETYKEPAAGGGFVDAKRARQVGKSVKINGPAHPVNERPMVPMAGNYLGGGFALTPNVDADFWTKWLEQNADNDVVTNGFIFAAPKTENVAAQAKERRKEKLGFEPIDPDRPPTPRIKKYKKNEDDD